MNPLRFWTPSSLLIHWLMTMYLLWLPIYTLPHMFPCLVPCQLVFSFCSLSVVYYSLCFAWGSHDKGTSLELLVVFGPFTAAVPTL